VAVKIFGGESPGRLVPINGTDPVRGTWEHRAFVPNPLPGVSPNLAAATHRSVGNARAALAALDSTARRLPNPRLLRRPTLQAEAQSTSALEGTYAPLADVLTVDEERPPNQDMREVFNYVLMADVAFNWIDQGRSLTVGGLGELQGILVRGTRNEVAESGSVRDHQVVIGHRSDVSSTELPALAARFIPAPPAPDLRASLQDLIDWMNISHTEAIDPVVSAAMAHYQFEVLHPFHDGNGRIGRLLIVIHLVKQGLLSEPTLTVSPWLEGRRAEYYDRLLAVSASGDWNAYVNFFAAGLEASARHTHNQMIALVDVQSELKEKVRRSKLRADTAHKLVDYAVGHPTFTVKAVGQDLEISYGRANGLVSQLVELGILSPIPTADVYRRRFYAHDVLHIPVGGH
jgi:Fic family protein